MHTDNGKEFFNSLITEYCESNDIILVHGRPYYPQSQGCIEAFNKEQFNNDIKIDVSLNNNDINKLDSNKSNIQEKTSNNKV